MSTYAIPHKITDVSWRNIGSIHSPLWYLELRCPYCDQIVNIPQIRKEVQYAGLTYDCPHCGLSFGLEAKGLEYHI